MTGSKGNMQQAFRDGTGQNERSFASLDPRYILIEERSVPELLRFAQKYARYVRYYDLENQIRGNWEGFLVEELEQYKLLPNEAERAAARKSWIETLQSYLENPEDFREPKDRFHKLSRPHLTLFLTFLLLLEKIREQMNGLTAAHLDFYYEKVLGLKKKAALPDLVHVLFELDPDISQLRVPAGTRLNAGTDSAGKDLIYETDRELVVNHGQVEEIRSLFVEKEIVDVQTLHRRWIREPEKALWAMIQLVLGDRDQNDLMPPFGQSTTVDLDFLLAQEELLEFAPSELQLSVGDFRLLRNFMLTGDPLQDADWNRMRAILTAHSGGAGVPMLFGEEIKRSTYSTDLTEGFAKADFSSLAGISDIEAFQEAVSSLEDYFFMSAEDLLSLIRLGKRTRIQNERIYQETWDRTYEILESAYKKKAEIARRTRIRNVYFTEEVKEAGTGFLRMVQFALGQPSPIGGFRLPVYKGLPGDPDLLYADLRSNDEATQGEAKNYSWEELMMKPLDFVRIYELNRDFDPADPEWEPIPELLEKSQRKIQQFQLPNPTRVEWNNIYSFPDARENLSNLDIGVAENYPRWKTFGQPQKGQAKVASDRTKIGFALSSPLLELSEGNREICLTFAFQPDTIPVSSLQSLFHPESGAAVYQPLEACLSTEEGWYCPEELKWDAGDFLVGRAGPAYQAQYSENDNLIVTSSGPDFVSTDVQDYFVWADGRIFRIVGFVGEKTIQVELAGQAEPSGVHTKYPEAQVFLSGIQLRIPISEQEPSIMAGGPLAKEYNFDSDLPAVRILLNNEEIEENETIYYKKFYQAFKDLDLQKTHLSVKAEGIRDFYVRNDDGELNPSTPFEPFGLNAAVGTNLYVAHKEIVSKRLESFRFDLEWMNPPEDFGDFYANYWKVAGGSLNPAAGDILISGNDSFTGNFFLYDQRAELLLGEVELFDGADARKPVSAGIGNVPEAIFTTRPKHRYFSLSGESFEEIDDIFELKRYLRLELNPPGFQADQYGDLLSRQVLSGNTDLQTLALPEPYEPLIRKMSLSYAASEIHQADEMLKPKSSLKIIQFHPFGEMPMRAEVSAEGQPVHHLFPQLRSEGELMIGLSGLNPPDHISLLFQLAEGSADPDTQAPPVKWSYLSGHDWKGLDEGGILLDETKGMIDTGIVTISLPEDASTQHSLMPSNLYWVRASIASHSISVSDVISIQTQGVSALFVDQENAADHMLNPLPPETISESTEPIVGLAAVRQPFSSSKGRAAEDHNGFYTRISERLRHKNRALSMWDYERLVLEKFPSIYKAKCLSADHWPEETEPGTVVMVVVPDIKGRFPFNPFEPKAPASTMLAIREYLEKLMPPFATLEVRNPVYVQVKTRLAVRFREGLNPAFYREQLQEDLKRFLAPWAYHEGVDIALGGKIYANVLVNFVEERSYVDYIARVSLFQSDDGITFQDVRIRNKGERIVIADRPDSILVSAPSHEIDLIGDSGFEDEDFGGINYARVELDLYVENDL